MRECQQKGERLFIIRNENLIIIIIIIITIMSSATWPRQELILCPPSFDDQTHLETVSDSKFQEHASAKKIYGHKYLALHRIRARM